MTFLDLSQTEKLRVLAAAQTATGMNAQSIEKDWWVTAVLRAITRLPYSGHLSFKGGTSLSKCWGLISRFSEDVDIAVDREYLGFGGKLSKTQIRDKLRRASCSFVRERMQYDIRNMMVADGIPEPLFKVRVEITAITTTDPETIYIEYSPVTSTKKYIAPSVKIEVSGRSMSEPIEEVAIRSIIDGAMPTTASFIEPPFIVRAVAPERTFIEKICLLHEEFAKPSSDIRVERMSRHMYDLVQMLGTDVAEKALADKNLFASVVAHRKTFIGMKGFDYSTLAPGSINIVPKEDVREKWEKDYEDTQLAMIYSPTAPAFEEIIDAVRKLNDRINRTK